MMNEITRCTRCIIPTSLTSVKLDESGVCNYCRKYENRYSNLEATKDDRKRQFEDIVHKVKKLKRYYDCLITLSAVKTAHTAYI